MSTESEPRVCPICRAPVPPEAPQGLCPRCLLLGASLATEAGQRHDPKSPPPAREELVAAFPQLEIMELIGQGGMGFVFKARQPKLDRLVALKILPQSLATDPAFAERFAREARLLARLNHPNIVTIHDFGQANGFFYLVMEYVDGVNLRQAMRGGRFTAEQALAIVPKICDALQFAHNEGILHRDIKPENIMLDAKGRVKIADFGIAKLMGNPANQNALSRSEPDGGTGEARPEGVAGITETGRVLGTPHYMAPEQIETPGRVDHRADIYSLGVVFYEMLTGELPLGRFAPPSQKSTADPRLDEVVIRTLAREPERRTQTAEEVKTQVETICREESHARGDDARARRNAANLAGYAMAAIFYGARRYWQWIAGAGVFVALVIFGLTPLYFDWSGQGKRPEAVVTAWPVSAENQLPGRTVWRWKCSIPADHALVFEVVSYTPDGVPEVVGNLSSSLVVGSNNQHNVVYELALQDGGKLSPDLDNEFRWDRSWQSSGGGGDYAPVWTNKPSDAGAILGLSDGTCHVHEGDSNMSFILMERAGLSPSEFRLLELHISLQAVPKDLSTILKGYNSMGDANWLAHFQMRQQAREHPATTNGAASEQELKERFETALRTHDTNAIFALYSRQGPSEESMLGTSVMWKRLAEAPTNGARASALFRPLPANFEPELVRDGIRYTPDVNLMGMLNGSLSWQVNGSNFSSGYQLPYGEQGDRFYLAGTTETRIYEPKTKDKPLAITVATSNNQTVVTFAGVYTYVQNGQEIRKEFKGTSAFNRPVFGDYVKSCVVQKTSDDQSLLQLVIWENGSNIFHSEWVGTKDPIIYKRSGATSQADAGDAGPANETTPADQTAAFSVPAGGTVPLHYHWMFNDSNTVVSSNAPASTETWAPSVGAGEKPDPTRILAEAKELMAKGQYEESLQRHLWYHNHALEYDPAQQGVRLSFALVDWIELGRRYPKAKAALVEIRDQKTRILQEGGGYSEMFQDVACINGYLQDDDATYALFQAIRKKDPQLAGQCYYYVESLLVKHGDYQLCLDYMRDPQSRFDLIKQGFDVDQRLDTNSKRESGGRLDHSTNDIFVSQTRQLIEILVGSGHKAEAEKIRDEAIAVLNDPRLRTSVADAEKKVHK